MAKVKKGKHCLNCDAEIVEANFCHNCGQINDTRHLTFGQLISESLANVLAFDGRFFKTFWTVIAKPGKVARDFTQGKRVRYMNPVRFYFLSSLLLIFAIQFQINTAPASTNDNQNNSPGLLKIQPDDSEEESPSKAELLASVKKKVAASNSFDKIGFMLSYLNLEPEVEAEEILRDLSLPNDFYHKFLFSQAQKVHAFNKEGGNNYDSFNRAILNKLFWILFFYIPILGLLLKIIYIRSKINYPEHLFFAFYQQAFFFQLLFVYVIFNLSSAWLSLIVFIYSLHLLLALKSFYAQKWTKTIFKFLLTNLLSTISFMLFFVLSALIVFISL